MRRKSFGSLSVTLAGTASAAAASASSPNVALRLLAAWLTTPSRTVISAAGTFQRLAAADTSMARAVAPVWRSWSHELAMAVLPPVPCIGPKARLLKRLASAGAPSTFTCGQAASSSSATMVARPV
jgi:hypothetical protein